MRLKFSHVLITKHAAIQVGMLLKTRAVMVDADHWSEIVYSTEARLEPGSTVQIYRD